MFKLQRVVSLVFSALVAASTAGVVLVPNMVLALQGDSKVEFRCAKPDESFLLEGSARQGTYSRGGKVWLTLTSSKSGQKLGFKNSSGAGLGFIKISQPGKWKVEDASGKDLFALEKELDGKYKLKDAADKLLFEVKGTEYGMKIDDGAKTPVYKIHKKENKLTLKSTDGAEVFSTSSSVDPLVVACFAFSSLDANQKAALAYAVSFPRN